MAQPGAGLASSYEIFIKRAITGIQKESWGRSKEAKDLREACAQFLSLLDQHEAGAAPVDGATLSVAVLHPIQLACSSSNVRIVELALGALHKLVAHAWLQGESGASEDLIADEADIVTRVIKLVIKCGEVNHSGLQLSVIRALLTFTTAEHFVPHGDALMSAVRTVFNLALGSEDDNIKRTACNALLQILNTVAKRVTAYQLHSYSSTPSRRESEHDGGALLGHHESQLGRTSVPLSPSHSLMLSSNHSIHDHPNASRTISTTAAEAGTAVGEGTGRSESGQLELPSDARLAQFASLADQHDIRGLEAAIGATTAENGQQSLSATTGSNSNSGVPNMPGTPAAGQHHEQQQQQHHDSSDASVAASAPAPGKASATQPTARSQSGVPDAHGAGSAQPPLVPLVQLSVTERDVLLVLTAFCKLASREAGLTEVESYLHQGKLLALELLVKVLQNPQHRWENVREELTRHLRQPLCITLLRNCAATDPAAFQLAIKLLFAIMMQPRLRQNLKAELGAFYPLFVLRPLEAGCGRALQGGAPGTAGQRMEQADLHTLFIVLGSLKQLCAEPQLVADLFVNYDCDLQAPILYERTMQALGLLAQKTDAADLLDTGASGGGGQAALKQQQETAARLAAVREAAARCIMSIITSLDQWSGPLKEAFAVRHAATSSAGVEAAGKQGAEPQEGAAAGKSEAERLEAAWAHKSTLSRGLSMFTTSPVKAVKYLISQQIMDSTPEAVAEFLRSHAAEIDKTALGEYFGHHEDFEISVMHAWVDMERYAGTPLDSALRMLLAKFRLPGEAQKIDRIMEKFAERYVRDNDGVFRNADGAYLLSFAIIMLNTDAHNPLAERRLGQADFVAMCHQPLSEEEGGGMEPVLPPADLEGIYQRILAQELQLHDGDATAQQRAQAAARSGSSRSGLGLARTRLAAALGLQVLSAPFKPVTRSWGRTVQGMSEADRKRRLAELAEHALMRQGRQGGQWVTAAHAELARPMLTVAAGPVLDALAFSLASAPDAAHADGPLRTLAALVQLSGVLRLDEICERAVGVLAAGAGVSSPAPYGSPAEAKQLAALKALLGVMAGPEAGSLGSGWATVLRTLSALEALTAELTSPVQPSSTPGTPGAASNQGTSNPFNRMFQALGINLGANALGSSASKPAATGSPARVQDNTVGQLQLRPAAGAALVLWSATEGREHVQQLPALSSALDGESVVVFFRAAAAVSREELDLAVPRVYFLQRLVECAHANIGRIRLIWSKLWAVISAHLTAAACHPNQGIALYAVESLQHLAGRLLARVELSHFRGQEEALRPFVAILRQGDDPAVRDAVVMHVMSIVAGQSGSAPLPRGLGSGWRVLLELLGRAASDSQPHVVLRAVHGLSVAVGALYQEPSGHPYMRETLKAVSLAASNHAAEEEACLASIHLLTTCADQLAAHVSGGSRRLGSSTSVAHPSPARPVASEGSGQPGLEGGEGGPLGQPLRSLLPQSSFSEAAGQVPDDSWAYMLGILADVVQQDPRPRVAAAATQAIFEQMQQHGRLFSDAAWHVFLTRVLVSLFRQAPPAKSADGSGASTSSRPALSSSPHIRGPAQPGPTPEFVARVNHYFPLMCEQLGKVVPAFYSQLLHELADTSIHWLLQPNEVLAMSGLHGFEQLATQVARGGDLEAWDQLLAMLSPITQQELQGVMSQTRELATHRGGAQQQQASRAGGTPGAPLPPELRSRSRVLIMTHRLLAKLHMQHGQHLPWKQQLQLVDPLLHATRTCMSFNQQLEAELLSLDVKQPAVLQMHSMPHTMPSAAAMFIAVQQQQVASGQQAVPAGGAVGEVHSAAVSTVQPPQSAGRVVGQGTDEEVADDILARAGSLPPTVVAGPAKPAAAAAAAAGEPSGIPLQAPLPAGVEEEGGADGLQAPAPVVASWGPQVPAGILVSTADSHASMQLALARLEMEAANAALDVLEHCVQFNQQRQEQHSSSSGGTDISHAGAAGQLLAELCMHIITHCAAANASNASLRNNAAPLVPHGTAQLGVPASRSTAGSAMPAAGGAECASTWLEGVRAPLLARAILLYMQLPGNELMRGVQALFSEMLVLMTSHQAVVRNAVACFFKTAVEPVVRAGAKPALQNSAETLNGDSSGAA